METTFDINKVDAEKRAGKASYGQCEGLGWKFSKKPNGKIDYKVKSRVTAYLYALTKLEEGFLTFDQANAMFNKKTLPKVHRDAIASYIKENS